MLNNSQQTHANPVASRSIELLPIFLALVTTLGGVPWIINRPLPVWLQPSMVGLLWAGLFLGGLGLAISHQSSIARILIVAFSGVVSTLILQRITDLTLAESCLAAVPSILVGWAIGRFDARPWQSLANTTGRSSPVQPSVLRTQLTMLDLFTFTTLTAVVMQSCLLISAPPLLLFGILSTLLIGCCCSWTAYHWALDDQYPIGIPFLSSLILIVCGIVLAMRVSALSSSELVDWLLTGPANVVASQVIVLLIVLGAIRGLSKPVSLVPGSCFVADGR